MKRAKHTILIATATMGLMLVANSCSERINSQDEVFQEKKEVFSKSMIKNASLKEKLDYKRHYLVEAVKAINFSGISPENFVSTASKGIQKNTFTLLDVIKYSSAGKGLSNSDLKKKLFEINNAFRGLEERDFNISFYIPFLENLSTNKAKRLKNFSDPIFIFEELDDANKLNYEGFKLNNEGELVSYDELISEERAEELTNNGQPIIVVGLQDANLQVNNGQAYSSLSSVPKKALWIGNLVVKSHKESWVAGASEIAIQMCQVQNNKLEKININSNGHLLGIDNEYIFAKVRRKDIKRKREAGIGAPILTYHAIDTTPSVYDNSNFYYVIYESDNFPVEKRHIKFPYYINGNQFRINYYSSDTEYYNSNAHNNKISNFVDNGEIRFRTEVKQ